MKDNLEDFIRNNREAFDFDEPGSHLWMNIEKELPGKKRLRILNISGIAASVLILLSFGYFMGTYQNSNELSSAVFATNEQYKDFNEAQHYYTTTIDAKIQEVKSIGVEDEVWNDLKQLDEVYEELKTEMLNSKFKDKEMMINLLINNYRTKIEILERIIEKSNKPSQQLSNSNETINI